MLRRLTRRYFCITGLIFVLATLFCPAAVAEATNADRGDHPTSNYTTLTSASTTTSSSYSNQANAASQFGPYHTPSDYGVPRHAYSPFDDAEEPPCPPGGCDFVAGQVLIKLKPEAMAREYQGEGILPSADTVRGLSDKYGITKLEPVFHNTTPLKTGGPLPPGMVYSPDLTCWFLASLSEGTQVP